MTPTTSYINKNNNYNYALIIRLSLTSCGNIPANVNFNSNKKRKKPVTSYMWLPELWQVH